jgi:Uma2 family endonuclease
LTAWIHEISYLNWSNLMATAAPPKLLTAEEFMDLDLGEGMHELVRGEIIEMPPPTPEHGRICVNVAFALESFGRQSGLGYALSNDSALLTGRGPDSVPGVDVCYYTHARWPRDSVGGKLATVAPDVAVEVLSPGNRPGETLKKISEYLSAGVMLVLLVDPKTKQVGVYRANEPFPNILHESDELEGFPELPGFRLRVAEFFV